MIIKLIIPFVAGISTALTFLLIRDYGFRVQLYTQQKQADILVANFISEHDAALHATTTTLPILDQAALKSMSESMKKMHPFLTQTNHLNEHHKSVGPIKDPLGQISIPTGFSELLQPSASVDAMIEPSDSGQVELDMGKEGRSLIDDGDDNKESSLPKAIVDSNGFVCRHRWTEFLEQNSYRLPPKLNEALKRYNRLHDKMIRQVPLLDAIKFPLNSPQNTIRYLVWIPTGTDLGGHIFSLLSSFLLALMTDRVLLVAFNQVNELLCEPFTRSSWILPKQLLAELDPAPKVLSMVRQRQPLRSATISIRKGAQSDDKHLLSCHGSIKGLLGHIQWLVVRSDMPFAEYLFTNPTHIARLKELFEGSASRDGGDSEPYHALFSFLIHPNNKLWERITAMYHAYYTDDYDRPFRIASYIDPLLVKQSPTKFNYFKGCIDRLAEPVLEPYGSRLSLYLAPANSTYNPEKWVVDYFSNEDTHIIGGSAIMYGTDDGWMTNWKRFIIDLWMISWSHEYLYTSSEGTFSYTGFLGHLIRAKGSIEFGMQNSEDQPCKMIPTSSMQTFSAPLEPIDCGLIKLKKS